MIILLLLLSGLLLEALIYTRWLWQYRVILAAIEIATLPYLTITLLFAQPNVATLLFGVGSLLRLVNMLRIVQNRMQHKRLYRLALQTSGYGMLLQLILIGVINDLTVGWPSRQLLYGLIAVQLCTALIVAITSSRTLRKMSPLSLDSYLSDKELPTLTVAIPARNETPDLVECLTSVIASDYPKLEIIVLDDCSHDKTPDIIKQFAHDGVRFVQGNEPDGHWLPKNAAYQRLLDEATGEIILFCGVDVRFEPTTLRRLITMMQTKQKSMISLLPLRLSSSTGQTALQPLRYWWEIALPRRLLNRTAVLSTCWAIRRSVLHKQGGFEAYSRSVLPERHFARHLTTQDQYSFMRTSPELMLTTVKSAAAQRDTVIRMRYPQIHRRLELAFLLAGAEVLLLLGPYILLAAGLLAGNVLVTTSSLVTIVLLSATNYRIVQASSNTAGWQAVLLLPLSILMELYLGLLSAMKYEFSTVDWKGRNICLPVMQVIPALPKTDKAAK